MKTRGKSASKALTPRRKSMLTAREFHQLAVVPPEVEWLANITNERTRRAYKKHVSEFAAFLQLEKPERCWRLDREPETDGESHALDNDPSGHS